MNADEITSIIRENLFRNKATAEEIRIQNDPFGGWIVLVISDLFSNLPIPERRRVALAGLQDEHFEWVDLLSPDERKLVAVLPSEQAPEDLPLWPEALVRGSAPTMSAPRFPSDLDEDLEKPIVVTFYSLRGGVGRSTALAYTARILAERGRKVVCLDMDLEAPGLAALFGKENDVSNGHGIVSLLLQLDQEEEPDLPSQLIPVTGDDNLFLIPAGIPDANYTRMLRFINPEAWYREDKNPLRLLLDAVRHKLPFKPDVILLDARTGITELSGPLLFDLADMAVVTFFPHPQAKRGTGLLVRGLLAAHTFRSDHQRTFTPELRFLVSPVPSAGLPEIVQRYQHRSLEWVAEWLEPANRVRPHHNPLLEDEITHFVRYRDDIATSDKLIDDSEVWRSFLPVAEWVERFLPTSRETHSRQMIGEEKTEVLKGLAISAGTAEQQADLLDFFVENDIVCRAMAYDVPLVLGRKGVGKTAIFRRLSEDPQFPAFIIHSPSDLVGTRRRQLSSDGFRQVEYLLERYAAQWRHFWSFYSAIALAHHLELSREDLPAFFSGKPLPGSESDMLDMLEFVLSGERTAIYLNEWLIDLDRAANESALLILDGLDTGFGSGEADRKRRRAALEGYFVFWMEIGPRFKNPRFKIFLREDIWKGLRFENKSHLYGRSITLKWTDQGTYLKVIIKQASRNPNFRKYLEGNIKGLKFESRPIDTWTNEEVFAAWNALVGERMKGGKTAFTRNWVWNRLADANDDHTPRYLLQLLHEAVPWETREHSITPYSRSIIRPRALIECLPEVSNEALSSLKEEFTELEPLMTELTKVGRTPLAATELEGQESLIPLAREVGLLGIYEGSDGGTERYKVPDIYRYALGMTRKGQA